MSGEDKKPEPGTWAQPLALKWGDTDKLWAIGWRPISAGMFGDWLSELWRTPVEITRNGAGRWSPSLDELAARLHVPVYVAESWQEEGVVEPWEIAVVRAYSKTGMVIPPSDRISAKTVRAALSRAKSLEDAAKLTRVPLPMLHQHLEVGAPARSHGRMYAIMASQEYRKATRSSAAFLSDAEMEPIMRRLMGTGATIEDIAAELDVSPECARQRMKKFGFVTEHAKKLRRNKRED